MRVAAYYRVSSTQQREAGTIEGQRREVRALVAARGWELVAELEDDGRSARAGKLAARAGFAQLLELARARAIDLVVCVAFDRLSRSADLAELGGILGTLQAAGVRLVTGGGEETDLGTFGGRISALVRAQLAAEESEVKSERAKRGRARAAAAGRAPCPPPLGLGHGAGGWQETPAAAVVREAYRRVAAGESASAVGEDLHRRRVPTARGGRWDASAVIRLVRNEVYDTGRWAANLGAVVVVPALVEPELAAAARAQLDRHHLRGIPRARQVHLLEGLARCGECGSRMMIHGMVRRHFRSGRIVEYRYAYYACERVRHAGRRGACSLPRQHADEVDARVWAALAGWLAQPDLVQEALLGQGERRRRRGGLRRRMRRGGGGAWRPCRPTRRWCWRGSGGGCCRRRRRRRNCGAWCARARRSGCSCGPRSNARDRRRGPRWGRRSCARRWAPWRRGWSSGRRWSGGSWCGRWRQRRRSTQTGSGLTWPSGRRSGRARRCGPPANRKTRCAPW